VYISLLQEEKPRKVIVFVEKIFRGKRYENPVEIYGVSYKPDYRLIPKDEEQLWWDRLANCKQRENVVPGSIELPPLMRVNKIFIAIYCFYMLIILFLQLILERDNKDFNATLPLEIRCGRDNVAQIDFTKTASYGPTFYKNNESS